MKKTTKITKKTTKKKMPIFIIAFTLVGVISLIFILLHTDFREILNFFRNITVSLVLSYIFVQLALMMVLATRWKTILRSQGHKSVNLFNLIKYRIAGLSVSFFTPAARMGGEGIKIRLMVKRENLSYSQALSSTTIENAVDLTTSAFFFFIGALVVLASANVEKVSKIFIGALVLSFVIALGILNYRLFMGKSVVHGLAKRVGLLKIKRIKNLENDIKKFDAYVLKFYKHDKKYFFLAVLLSVMSWMLMFIEYYLVGQMLGITFNIWMIFLIVTLVGLAYIVPVPMAIGSLEAGQVSAFKILGLSTAAGVGLSFIVRVKDLFIALVGAGIISMYGFSFAKALKKRKIGDRLESKK